MTHETHFLSLSYTAASQPTLVRGSIVKRCIYFGLNSPFWHDLPTSTHTHTHTGDFTDLIYCKLPLSMSLLPCSLPSPRQESKCYFAEFQWWFFFLHVHDPPHPPLCTFLAKCCKINGGPLKCQRAETERAKEKTSGGQPENGQLVKWRSLQFVVTDGHTLSRPPMIFTVGEQN